MQSYTVLDVGSKFGMGCGKMFRPWGVTVLEPETLKAVEDYLPRSSFVVFGGGSDIHPSLYNHRNVASGVGPTPSYRDRFEYEVFHLARDAGLPMVGLCRGAQLLCALSGGSLIQDVHNHAGSGGHDVSTVDDQTFSITSAHHQMMFPTAIEHELLAWSQNLSKGREHTAYDIRKINVDVQFFLKEPEIVYFPKTKSIGIQGHPEWMDEYSPVVNYIRKLIEQKLFKIKV